MKRVLAIVSVIGFLILGSVVLSQYSADLLPLDSELSTQNNGYCATIQGIYNQCSNVNIEIVYLSQDGFLLIGTSGNEGNMNCAASSTNRYLSMDNGSENYKEIYALILSAKLNNLPITVRLNATTGCSISYVFIN